MRNLEFFKLIFFVVVVWFMCLFFFFFRYYQFQLLKVGKLELSFFFFVMIYDLEVRQGWRVGDDVCCCVCCYFFLKKYVFSRNFEVTGRVVCFLLRFCLDIIDIYMDIFLERITGRGRDFVCFQFFLNYMIEQMFWIF